MRPVTVSGAITGPVLATKVEALVISGAARRIPRADVREGDFGFRSTRVLGICRVTDRGVVVPEAGLGSGTIDGRTRVIESSTLRRTGIKAPRSSETSRIRAAGATVAF